MSGFACVWVPWFAASAAVRCEPALAERPLVLVRGAPPTTRVEEASEAAREHGVRSAMTEVEARARCPGLVARACSEDQVVSAQHALLEAARGVSPRVEEAGPGVVHVDLGGLTRLFGDPPALGRRLVQAARAVGLPARVGVASTRTVAGAAVRLGVRDPRHGRGPVVVVPPGHEQAWLASAPLDVLDLPDEIVATLARWGVTTLGAAAALPRDGLLARLGPIGLRVHDLARGRDCEPFRVWTPRPFWEEAQDLEWEIVTLGALRPVLEAVLERLMVRLHAGHVVADRVEVRLSLASGARHETALALAYPTREVTVVLALVMMHLESAPPPAAVTGVAVSVGAVRERVSQAGLWQPPAPAPRDLAALGARLASLVGSDGFGSPGLVDSHRPDALTLVPFASSAWDPASAPGGDTRSGTRDGRLVLRRCRPPHAVEVVADGERPMRVRWGRPRQVVRWAGPWRTSGEWWDARAWARDEWDVLLDDGTLCRLACDRRDGRWYVDGMYD